MSTLNFIKIFSIIFIFILSVTSCKKDPINAPVNNCPTTIVTSTVNPTPPKRLGAILAYGFFVYQKYYSILNSVVTLDSVVSYAFEAVRYHGKTNYTYNTIYPPAVVDSVKTNNVRYKTLFASAVGYSYNDTTHLVFTSPRHCEFYGDTTFYDNINYTNNTPLPDYTGYSGLPDSVYYNADFVINVGARSNTKETQLIIKYKRYPYLTPQNKYVENNDQTYKIGRAHV